MTCRNIYLQALAVINERQGSDDLQERAADAINLVIADEIELARAYAGCDGSVDCGGVNWR